MRRHPHRLLEEVGETTVPAPLLRGRPPHLDRSDGHGHLRGARNVLIELFDDGIGLPGLPEAVGESDASGGHYFFSSFFAF